MRPDLIEAARSGDRQAFDVLATGIVDRLYSVARLILRDADRAGDATQEALVRCWRDLPTLRDTTRFDPWLNRVLVNAINDEFRRDRRQRAFVTILRQEPATSDASTAFAVRDQLDRGFRRVSPEHRTVIVLRPYLDLSIEEAAASIGIPVGTAESRLHYATEANAVSDATTATSSAEEAFEAKYSLAGCP